MKIYFLAAALPTVAALQSGYLSQLNTGTYEGVNGKGKADVFFPDPAEAPKSIYGYTAPPPSAREVPEGSVSMLNRGTYEGVNGVGFRAAFFPDPAETPKSIYGYQAAPPSAREVPDGVVSMLNRGTYEGINGAGYSSAFFPDPAIQLPPKELYSGAPMRRGGAFATGRTTAMPPPVVPLEKPAVASPDIQDLYSSGPARRRAATQTDTWAAPTGPSPELLELWSNQVSVELAASQLYLSASIWFRSRNMQGMAAWMLDESGEERGHGLAILEHAMKSQFPVQLKSLDAPKSDWQNPVQVWESILRAEQTNTQNLLRLSSLAQQCGLYDAVTMLAPFNEEQTEAEQKVGGILVRVRNATPQQLMDLDRRLGLDAGH